MDALPKPLAQKLRDTMDWELLEALCAHRESYILNQMRSPQSPEDCADAWGQMEACRWLGTTLRKVVENTLKP